MRKADVICLGVHILDVLAHPVAGPPMPPGRNVLSDLRLTAAGSAAGTAVDLAKLGASVTAIGAIGDDPAGDLVSGSMREHGVEIAQVTRKEGLGTHTSLLMVGADGERHTVASYRGASESLSRHDVDFDSIAAADVLHVGGADVLGDFAGDPLVEIMELARSQEVIVTLDLLTPCDANTARRLAPALRAAQYFFPNEQQAAALSGEADPAAAAAFLRSMGVECVIVTLGAEGSLVATPGGETRIPGFEVDVVDTTGCGDAYAAGFIVGIANGWDPGAAGWLGGAASALVAGGLGSDAGITNLETTLEFLLSRCPERIAALVGDLARARGDQAAIGKDGP